MSNLISIIAAVTHAPEDPYVLENVELAEPQNDEVLVKVVACGLCHTDEFGRKIGLPMPLVLGHEGAGIVEKVGPNVQEIEVGDHVAFSYASCGRCRNCISGRPSYCSKFNQINFGGVGADGKTKLFQKGKPVPCSSGSPLWLRIPYSVSAVLSK